MAYLNIYPDTEIGQLWRAERLKDNALTRYLLAQGWQSRLVPVTDGGPRIVWSPPKEKSKVTWWLSLKRAVELQSQIEAREKAEASA